MDKTEAQNKKSLLKDARGRRIHYLRLSVTDRCNLKCSYCHPPYDMDYMDRSEICSFGELIQIVRIASRLGIDKVRLTGGEVFLRKEVMEFIGNLSVLDGIREVTLTTNGTLIRPHLKRLREMGLRRINISLDTLSEDLYYRITGSREFLTVLNSIHKALKEGFRVKVNMVVLQGVNDGEINDFLYYFMGRSVEVRFIEFMPLCGAGWKVEYLFPYEKILETVQKNFEIRPLFSPGVAEEFVATDGNGLIGKMGVISPVSRSFCSSCSRIRLSANGELKPCLFSKRKVPLLPFFRGEYSPEKREEKITEAFQEAAGMKSHCIEENHANGEVYIRSIGG